MKEPARTLEQALYDLLFDRSFREHFLRGEHDALAVSDEDLVALEAIDRDELVKTSSRIVAGVLRGNFDGHGGLRAAYPGVFDAIRDMELSTQDLMFEFIASPEFGDYRELPFAGRGTCIEEAFFLFLRRHEHFCAADPNNLLLLTHEFLTVMLSILTVNPRPHFRIATVDLVRHNGHASYATNRYPVGILSALLGRTLGDDKSTALLLYAATPSGRFVSGVIDELSLRLIEAGSTRDAGKGAKVAARLAALDLIEQAS